MDMKKRIIEAAKTAIKAGGGQVKLAEKLAQRQECIDRNLTQQKLYWRIQKWSYNGIPGDLVLTVESVTGISRHQLRPDLHGEAA